jgi:hypothetical protein
VITLMVNYYAEDPGPAIRSAELHLPIDRVVALDGRYAGFPPLLGEQAGEPAFLSEHEKRCRMLELAGDPDPRRWLFWLDCDERVIYSTPILDHQLVGLDSDVGCVDFIEPVQRDAPGLEDPRRGRRDRHVPLPRLIRHLPGLAYRNRHDYLIDASGRCLIGWKPENAVPAADVDVIVVHERWRQGRARREAKEAFYVGPIRTAESKPVER